MAMVSERKATISCRRRYRGSRGFTLIELLLVVVIIAVFSGGIVAAVHGRTRVHALRLAAKDLASSLEYAMAEAHASGVGCRVFFGADRGFRYRVEQWSASSDQFEAVAGTAGRWHELGTGVDVRVSTDPSGGGLVPADALEFAGDGSGFAGCVVVGGGDQGTVRLRVLPAGCQVWTEGGMQ